VLLAPVSVLRLTSIITRIAERVPARLNENVQSDYVIQGLPVRLSMVTVPSSCNSCGMAKISI
jgi:hypothetical protein